MSADKNITNPETSAGAATPEKLLKDLPKLTEDPKGFFRWLRNKFFTGLFVACPLLITLWILWILYNAMSSLSDPLVRVAVSRLKHVIPTWAVVDGTIPGAGLILTVAVLLLLGIIVSNFIGRKIARVIDGLLLHLPGVQTIYKLSKQVVESFETMSQPGGFADKQVVYVRYPGMQGYLIGFLTRRFTNAEGKRMAVVIIPTSPSPVNGFIVILNEADVLISDLEMDVAWKLIVSGGLVAPQNVRKRIKPLGSVDH